MTNFKLAQPFVRLILFAIIFRIWNPKQYCMLYYTLVRRSSELTISMTSILCLVVVEGRIIQYDPDDIHIILLLFVIISLVISEFV